MKTFSVLDKNGIVLFQEDIEEENFQIMRFLSDAKKALSEEDFSRMDPHVTIRKIKVLLKHKILSILVIEDDPTTLLKLKMDISMMGHYVEGYLTADDGLEIYNKSPFRFDAIITDNMMPSGESGSSFAKKVKENNDKIKLFIISGNLDSIDKDIYDYGIDGKFKKPLTRPALAGILNISRFWNT
jgi:CheY-like chemotaxis protein